MTSLRGPITRKRGTMTRSLGFRAWHKRRKEMLPVYGLDLAEPKIQVDEKHWLGFGIAELMQFTGLNDGKGTPIFEGDILEDIFGLRVEAVHYDYGTAVLTGFTFRVIQDPNDLTRRSGWPGPAYAWEKRWLEIATVIGNRFESPELLRSGNGAK